MASYTLAAVALAAALTTRSWVPVARAAIAAALGLALAGVFLIPALWEQRWIDIGQANGTVGDPGLLIENHWLFPPAVSTSRSVPFAEAHVSSLITSPMIVVALASVLAFWWRRRRLAESGEPQVRRWWLPLSLIPIAGLYLQLPISRPARNLLPKVRFLQFPWRWLLVLEAPMAIFFAAAIWPRSAARRWQRRAVGALCTAYLLLSTVFAAKTFFRVSQPDDSLAAPATAFRSGHGFWGADEYAPPGGDNFIATGLPDACLVNASNAELGVTLVPDYNPVYVPDRITCTAIAAPTAAARAPPHNRRCQP